MKPMKEMIQITFDYSVFDQDTTAFLQETEDKIVGRTQRYIKDTGRDLLEAKKRIGHGNFVDWIRARFDMSEDTAQNLMNVARNFGEIPNGSFFADRALYLLSRKSTPEDARQEAKDRAMSGEAITLEVAKEIVETKKALKQEQEARLEAEKKVESLEQQALFFQTEAQLVKSENEALKAKDHETIEHVLQEEKRNLQREYQIKRSEKEKELKEEYADRYQQYQLKAETTIHSLISHGKKRMAETQMTIEHTVSAGMLQAVQELGGKQVDSLLAQIRALRETLDLAEIKLISSSSTDIVEATVVIDSRIL
jgi:Protein of unknown function (DUF3102)